MKENSEPNLRLSHSKRKLGNVDLAKGRSRFMPERELQWTQVATLGLVPGNTCLTIIFSLKGIGCNLIIVPSFLFLYFSHPPSIAFLLPPSPTPSLLLPQAFIKGLFCACVTRGRLQHGELEFFFE